MPCQHSCSRVCTFDTYPTINALLFSFVTSTLSMNKECSQRVLSARNSSVTGHTACILSFHYRLPDKVYDVAPGRSVWPWRWLKLLYPAYIPNSPSRFENSNPSLSCARLGCTSQPKFIICAVQKLSAEISAPVPVISNTPSRRI